MTARVPKYPDVRAPRSDSEGPRAPARPVARVAVVLVAIGLVLGLSPAGAGATSPPGLGLLNPATTTSVASGAGSQVAGMALEGTGQSDLSGEIARLHSDGLNTISIFVWWLSTTQDPDQLAPYSGTQSDAGILTEVADARQLGMQTILVPIFYCETCQGGWRGVMKPGSVDDFFASYQSMVDHYAELAQTGGVGTLFVGSEMDSLETYTPQWQQVISSVRGIYQGRIGYEENWEAIGHATFVNRVDVIGISAYFPLDDAPEPTLAELLGDWNASHASAFAGSDWVAKIEKLQAAAGKPILFGEVGYMSGQYAAKQPYLNWQGVTDWQLQADLYQAVLETFQGFSWWDGAVWWNWYIPTTSNDDSRTPRGKTAETFLQRWYAGGQRPASPDQPLVGPAEAAPTPTSTPAPPAVPKPVTAPTHRTSAPPTTSPAATTPAATTPAATTPAATTPVRSGPAAPTAVPVTAGAPVAAGAPAGTSTSSAPSTTAAGLSGRGAAPTATPVAAAPGAGRPADSRPGRAVAPVGDTRRLVLIGALILAVLVLTGLWFGRARLRRAVSVPTPRP